MMNDNRRHRIANGRNGDHVSIIDRNCQRRVLDRNCDFHAIKFGQEQEAPILDTLQQTCQQLGHRHDSSSSRCGNPQQDLIRPAAVLSLTTYVMDLLCRIFPSLSLATYKMNLLCRIFPSRLQSVQQQQQEFRISEFQKKLKIRVLRVFEILNCDILNSEIQNIRILVVVAAREWLATPACSS